MPPLQIFGSKHQIFVGPNSNSNSCGWVTKSWMQLLPSLEYLLRLLKTELSSLPPNLDKAKFLLIWPICRLQICSTEIKSNIMWLNIVSGSKTIDKYGVTVAYKLSRLMPASELTDCAALGNWYYQVIVPMQCSISKRFLHNFSSLDSTCC